MSSAKDHLNIKNAIILVAVLAIIYGIYDQIPPTDGEVDTIVNSDSWDNNHLFSIFLIYYGWIGGLVLLIGWGLGKGKVMGIGALLILFAIFFSGAGDYARSSAERVSTVLSCEADPNQSKCIELALKRAQEEAREQAEKIAQAKFQAELEAARNYTPPPPPLTNAVGKPCGGFFEDLKDCQSFVFGRNEKFDHYPPIGFCSFGDGAITAEALDNHGNVRWTGNRPGVVGRVFIVKVGDSYGGHTCGG